MWDVPLLTALVTQRSVLPTLKRHQSLHFSQGNRSNLGSFWKGTGRTGGPAILFLTFKNCTALVEPGFDKYSTKSGHLVPMQLLFKNKLASGMN